MKPKQLLASFIVTLILSTPLVAQYSSDDWEERDTWMNVSKIFEMAQIEKGMHVADVGCHEGYLTVRLSKKVTTEGQVYAVDVEEYRLDALKEHLADRDIGNVKVILGDYDNPKLPLGMLDAVILMDTYHEIEEYLNVLRHIKQALKPNGRLLVLEKLKTHKKGKSREEQARAHTLSAAYVKDELQQVGFEIIKEVKDFGNWQENKEKRMWILVAQIE